MRITENKYLRIYKDNFGGHIKNWFEEYEFSDDKISLDYNTKTSAVHSSNIEGNSLDISSFMNSLTAAKNFKKDKEVQEIKDLVEAYKFAQKNELSQPNFLKAHQQLSNTFLIKSKRGKYRTDQMGVFGESGLVYLAIEPEFVQEKMNEFFDDLEILKKMKMNIEEVFYFASLIHLIFVHIHPFWDGNGSAARLLEKWFISEKINSRAWKLKSEKYYKEHLQDYYQNIGLGVNYYELNYDKCLPFLKMLPHSLKS